MKSIDFFFKLIDIQAGCSKDQAMEINVTPSLEIECNILLSDVKLPKKVKCPGKPKRAALTSIGLLKKQAISKPIAFAQKH